MKKLLVVVGIIGVIVVVVAVYPMMPVLMKTVLGLYAFFRGIFRWLLEMFGQLVLFVVLPTLIICLLVEVVAGLWHRFTNIM